jgi:hypothetical protein
MNQRRTVRCGVKCEVCGQDDWIVYQGHNRCACGQVLWIERWADHAWPQSNKSQGPAARFRYRQGPALPEDYRGWAFETE